MKRSFLTYALLLVAFAASAQSWFTVGDYNVRYDEPNDAKKGNGWEQRMPHICNLINYQEWDLIGLQEVLHQQLQDLKSNLRGYDYVGVARDNGKEEGEYAPIFYKTNRMRVLESGTFWLSKTPDKVGSIGWDASMPRICTWARFEDKRTKWKFYMFNLHMDHIGKEAQRESAKLMIAKVKEMCGDQPYILTGDFNADQNSDVYSILTTSGAFADAATKTNRKLTENGSFNGFNPDFHTDGRIDHIFVSNRVSVHKWGIVPALYWGETGKDKHPHQARVMSDHYPVEVQVDFPRLRSPEDWANYGRYARDNAKVGKATVVFMGNSITDGWDHYRPEFFKENPGFVCRGIGGQVTAQMLARFRADVINLKPEKVVILAGTNDIAMNQGYVALEHIYENIISMAELAIANGIKPYIASILPGDTYSWSWELDRDRIVKSIKTVNDMLRAYCEKNGLVYVDYFAVMNDGNNALKKEYQQDAIHPNKAGYLVMEKVVLEALAK